jgi:hypothetical protein
MNDPFKIIDEIADEILKDKDNAKAIEFTKVIGTLLRENGVTPICTEYVADGCFDNKLGFGYKCCFEKLDFTEHDKVFEDRIAKKWELIDKLYKENVRLEEKCMKKDADIYNFQCENRALEQRIAELEIKETETCEKEPMSDDCRQSMEWYENRHQSDCIEINRLNTTIDVLIHKVEYLRQFAGLE